MSLEQRTPPFPQEVAGRLVLEVLVFQAKKGLVDEMAMPGQGLAGAMPGQVADQKANLRPAYVVRPAAGCSAPGQTAARRFEVPENCRFHPDRRRNYCGLDSPLPTLPRLLGEMGRFFVTHFLKVLRGQ